MIQIVGGIGSGCRVWYFWFWFGLFCHIQNLKLSWRC